MPSSLDYLKGLIAFPTISRDGNLDLIGYVEKVLARLVVKLSE